MSIILFFLILGVLVLSHEFGHFIVAKRAGIRVDEFGFGFPPKLFGFRRGETTYTFNLLPFGGFVKIFGENPDEESLSGSDRRRALNHQGALVQAAVLVAGVTCNLLLAWLLLSIGFISGVPVSTSSGFSASGPVKLLITSVRPDSPAALSGLKAGDEIVSLTAPLVHEQATISPTGIQQFVSAHPNSTLNLSYHRPLVQAVQQVSLRPASGLVADHPAIGITMDEVVNAKLSFFPALWEGAKLTYNLTLATVLGLWQMIQKAFVGQASLDNITGPVGLVGLVSDAAGLGLVYLLSFTALISINLAVLNLVPFPALDGGRLLFLLIEKLKGSAIEPRIANTVNLVGFGLLLLLMAVVTYSDLRHLFTF